MKSNIIVGILASFTTIGVVVTAAVLWLALTETYHWLMNKFYMKSRKLKMFTIFCVRFKDFEQYMKEKDLFKFHNIKEE